MMCRSWVCSEGIYKGTSGNKGVDKLNAAYHHSDSDSTNAATGYQAGVDEFNNIMDMLSRYSGGTCK